MGGYRVEGQFHNLSIDITHVIMQRKSDETSFIYVFFVWLWKAIETSFLKTSLDIQEKASQSMLWSRNWNDKDQNLVSIIPWTSLEDFFQGLC